MIGFTLEANQLIKAGRESAGNTLASLTTNERMRFAMADTVQSENPRERNLTQEFLRGSLDYDPLTGIFRWKARADRSPQWNGKWAGKVAGTVGPRGYTVIRLRIDGADSHFYAHRLAFIYMTGECPPFVDHEDRDKHNNRWLNLRSATKAQNSQNRTLRRGSTSGFKGVSWSKYAGKWGAYININGRKETLGLLHDGSRGP